MSILFPRNENKIAGKIVKKIKRIGPLVITNEVNTFKIQDGNS